jgi:protein Tex
VPFIARYRKEATDGLDDSQLRTLQERLVYLRELEERRAVILASVGEQGKLTDGLRADLEGADNKARLEDLYLPYRPKRRTKAQIAREAGLEPLADVLLSDPTQAPEQQAAAFVDADKGVADAKAALDGARQILMERWAEDAALLARLRAHVQARAEIKATVVEGKQEEGAKFRDYFAHSEPLKDVPSHRALALFRGRNEGVLTLAMAVDEDDPAAVKPTERMIAEHAAIADKGRAGDKWLLESVRWAWKAKISLHLELDLMGAVRERAEEEAIRVFARNLKDLLLAAPAGPRATLGLDPGIRTGVKVAVVDATGKLVETATVYPFQPRNDVDGALASIAVLAIKHSVELIAIGNGTASRETDKLATELIRRLPERNLTKIVVSEAGASVYSASELASKELPGVDVTLRGAASIARRLQDPLAELVKIDPKSIGVGQYQHDVNQTKLARALDAVVEDAVNGVGVDLNTASPALLARVSGLTEGLAANIVSHRDAHGAFRTRKQLLDVPRLGPKAFEQCAGFLRIANGDNPLDASTVHPEAYPLVERIVAACGRDIRALMGDSAALKALEPERFMDARFGLPTVRDILTELEKPGRDPRPEFRTASFKDGVEEIKDLEPGMLLEGTVTNVTNFGAFVDIGVHQDGLVHVSQLADRFVKDAHEVVKAGDIVQVRVVEVDVKRKRIALSMRKDGAGRQQSDNAAGAGAPTTSRPRGDAPRDNRRDDRRDDRRSAPARTGNTQRPAAKPQPAPAQSKPAASIPDGPLAAAMAKALALRQK